MSDIPSVVSLITRNLTFVTVVIALGGFLGFVLNRVRFETQDTLLPGLAFALGEADYHAQGYILILLIATAVFIFFVIPRVAAEDGRWLWKLLILAFFFKVGVGLFRLFWVWVEKGGADSALYYSSGVRFAPDLWRLDFSFIPQLAHAGTDFAQLYAVFIIALIGPTLPGGFLVYALFSFTACILYYKAFCIAFPAGNRKLFAAIIFFFPSWVYWPSSIGKDALMALFIAMCVYGVAQIIVRRNIGGLVVLGLGMLAVATIRPHIAGILGVAMALPIVMRLPVGSKPVAPVARILYLAVAAGLAWLLINNAATALNLEDTSIDAALERYDSLSSRAERGGSSFEPTPITEPLGVPMAFITLLFRPFPWEAPNGAALVLSLEGVAFAGLVLWRLGSIRRALTSMFSNPYLMFLIVYFVMWALALTVIGNFSLLGRQRLMVFPAFFMLLAYYGGAAEDKKVASLAHNGRQAFSTNQQPNRTRLEGDAG